jgi:putative ABC transport system permease protein
MLLFDFFRLAWKALRDRKIRSLLTIMGIAVGSAILIALIASSAGLNAGISANIEKTGTNILTLRTSGGFFLSSSTSTYQLSALDVSYLKTIPNVVAVYPYYSYGGSVSQGGASLSATLVGIDLTALPTLYKGLTVESGSMPAPSDATSAVVGWSIANPTSGTPIGVNQLVDMSLSIRNGKSTTMTYGVLARGILAQYGTTLSGDVDDTVYISLQGASFLAKSPYYSGIYVVVDNSNDVTAVDNTITAYYGTNVRVISPGQILSSIESITGSLGVFLGGIGAVSLFVATIGIINTMYVSVMERTREIGILKAIGYRPRQIMGMFLSEAALTGMIGAWAGTALGYVLAFLMGGFFSFGGGGSRGGPGMSFGGGAIQPVFSPELVVFALTFPIALATAAGLYPAWLASKKSPVNALKYE